VTIVWRHAALTSARRFMADQAGMRQVNRAIAALAEDPEPPDAFVRGSYRRLRVGLTGCCTRWQQTWSPLSGSIRIVRVDKDCPGR
jgi:hypothetical protein